MGHYLGHTAVTSIMSVMKSNQIFICSNERSQKIDNNSDNEQDSKDSIVHRPVTAVVVRVVQILPGSTINLASRRNPHDDSDERLVEFNSNERSFTIRDYSRRVRGTDRYFSLPRQFLSNKVHFRLRVTAH